MIGPEQLRHVRRAAPLYEEQHGQHADRDWQDDVGKTRLHELEAFNGAEHRDAA